MNKIRELYKIIGEFTGSEKGKQLGERQKVETEWKEIEKIKDSLNVNPTEPKKTSGNNMGEKRITYPKREVNKL